MRNVNTELFADVRAVEEYNRQNGTMLTYGQYKVMLFLDSLKKKKSFHRKSGSSSFSKGKPYGKVIVKRKAAKNK
jgi:hypothetical protein